mmetsp:Transcript_69303/g.224004  ORF Transcript_69303/g.224004 Transcript_69303/m.224004 type:complete len:330 (-) Transcript_69303:528-1517(-)
MVPNVSFILDPRDWRPAFSSCSCHCCPASLSLLWMAARPVGGSSRTLAGVVMPYCICNTSGSHTMFSSAIAVFCFSAWNSTPSISSKAVLRSFWSFNETVHTLVYLIWSFLRPSTRSVVSSAAPSEVCSKTLNFTERSPMKRNLHNQGPPSSVELGEADSSSCEDHSESKSAAADSTRTFPSTVSVTILLDLYFFSTVTVCSAMGPIWNLHDIFVLLSGVLEMALGSEVRYCVSVLCGTWVMTLDRSFVTSMKISLGAGSDSRAVPADGGVARAKKCVMQSSDKLSIKERLDSFRGLDIGTLRTRKRSGVDSGFFDSCSRMSPFSIAGM